VTKDGTLKEARDIFRIGKMLQHHVYTAYVQLDQEMLCGVDSELSLAQFKLLMSVRHLGEPTLGELASHLGVSSPSVSVMVDRLVERGVLVRERSTMDRRKVVLRISGDEERRCLEIEQRMLAVFVELLEEIGPDKTAMWVEALAAVEKVLARKRSG
jgi:DNA-binding MarR family transcriptional regulator